MKKKKSVKSTILKTIISIAVIAGCITAGYFLNQKQAFQYNENSDINGNTPGNLYNNGMFTELNGTVYFSNPFDYGKLYKMNPDCTEITKLNDETVYSLNAYGSYLYFSKNNFSSKASTAALRGTAYSAMRCDLNGNNVTTLCEEYSGSLSLIGNKVYFQRYTNKNKQTIGTLCSIGIDGKDFKEILDEEINTSGVKGSTFYYTGVADDHNIYRMNTISNSSSLVYEGNCYMPIPNQNYIYFLDLDNNYALCRIDLNHPEEVEVLVNKRIATYNMNHTYIYFQIDEGIGTLCRIKKDGSSDYEIIADGHYHKINLTSTYVYYYKVGNDKDAFRTPANNTIKVEKLSDVFDLSIYEKD